MADAVREVDIAIVGAGLVGSLLAVFLVKRGYRVDVFERRPDMRREAISAGRSINLNISCRGLEALKRVDALDEVSRELVPMTGRLMHARTGELTYQPYGKDDSEYGNSVSRAGLNKILMNRAEATQKARFHFNMKATGLDFQSGTITFADRSGEEQSVRASLIFATDGSASAVRRAMVSASGSGLPGFTESIDRLDYGYKELYIPPSEGGGFRIEKNALHIWPRGSYMVIALPNFDGSFTVTLFLPFEGEKSFASLTDESSVRKFFQEEFPDAVPLMPGLVETFFENPTGHMDTVKCGPWQVDGRSVLMGDAAHAIVPFFGQGMNCGFEDLTVFDQLLDEHLRSGSSLTLPGSSVDDSARGEWQQLFARFFQERKENCDAIADMAVENFVEMRDRVADPRFLLHKMVEKRLANEFPGRYISRYQLVTFTNVPYKVAQQAGAACEEILAQLCAEKQSAGEIDLQLAERLIESKLQPILAAQPELTSV